MIEDKGGGSIVGVIPSFIVNADRGCCKSHEEVVAGDHGRVLPSLSSLSGRERSIVVFNARMASPLLTRLIRQTHRTLVHSAIADRDRDRL